MPNMPPTKSPSHKTPCLGGPEKTVCVYIRKEPTWDPSTTQRGRFDNVRCFFSLGTEHMHSMCLHTFRSLRSHKDSCMHCQGTKKEKKTGYCLQYYQYTHTQTVNAQETGRWQKHYFSFTEAHSYRVWLYFACLVRGLPEVARR